MRFTPLCVLLLLSSCSLFGDDKKAEIQSLPAAIEYRVSGSELLFITYTDSIGERVQEGITPPWSYSFQADTTRPLYVYSQPSGSAVSLSIRIDGEMYRQTDSEDGEAAVLAWASTAPRVGYIVSGSNAGTLTMNTAAGEVLIDAPDDTYSIRELYSVSAGFEAYIRSDVAPGINCPAFSVVYVDHEDQFYTLDTAQTCDAGKVVEAVIPGF